MGLTPFASRFEVGCTVDCRVETSRGVIIASEALCSVFVEDRYPAYWGGEARGADIAPEVEKVHCGYNQAGEGDDGKGPPSNFDVDVHRLGVAPEVDDTRPLDVKC